MGDSRGRAVAGGPLPLTCFVFVVFFTKTEATTKVKLICNKIPTFHTFTAFQKYITIPMKMI